MSEDFKEKLDKAKKIARAKAQAEEQSNRVKDLIIEHMAGIYFRVEQLRDVMGKDVTVAEVVNDMPDEDKPIVKAVKYSWTQDYMLEAFHEVMKQDGEDVDEDIIGNVNMIDAPDGPQRIKI